MQISKLVTCCQGLKKGNSLPWVSQFGFPKPSPTTFPTMQRSQPPRSFAHNDFHRRSPGLPGVSASAKISNGLLHPPEILHEPWNTLLDCSGILTRKRGLWSWRKTGESANMVFKVTFREKLPDSQFRPWKEDIESSQKDPGYNF